MSIGVYSYILWGELYDMPYKEMIQSVSPIADEIVVVTDPRFNDGTIEKLQEMAHLDNRIKVIIQELDLNDPGVDGKTKAIARSHCKSPYLMQMDADEVCREEDLPKIKAICDNWDSQHLLIGTGVINWFNGEYLKLSAAGWTKERVSMNRPHLTHGIPQDKRIPRGNYFYARDGTDGAGYILLPSNTGVGSTKIVCNFNAFPLDYKSDDSIYIHHYSWYSLPRKWEMKTTWHYMWGSLFGRYNGLSSYTVDQDRCPVDFWHPQTNLSGDSYIEGMKHEMKEKSIIKAPEYIEHPFIMRDWIERQRVYYPPGLFRKEYRRNM